ncbi:MAG: CvpA family protein [Prevotellaceae bacterium]|jgi:membrane protein required for colicin V production|nr:CvpA family protein [Prevotellaceae bacterium]
MSVIDIFLLLVILAGGVLGYVKGFIKQFAALLGLVGGLLVARALYAPLARKIGPSLTDSMTVAQVLSFIAIWIAVPLLCWVVAALFTRMIEIIRLGWLNRLLGALLGMVKYVLLLSLLICVLEYIDSDSTLIKPSAKRESVLYAPVRSVVDWISGLLPERVEIPSDSLEL